MTKPQRKPPEQSGSSKEKTGPHRPEHRHGQLSLALVAQYLEVSVEWLTGE